MKADIPCASASLRGSVFPHSISTSTRKPSIIVVDEPTVYVETTVISYEMATPSSQLVVGGSTADHPSVVGEGTDRFAIFVSAFVIREASAGDRTQQAGECRFWLSSRA